MNVLLIGSGGREHALAWKMAQSPRLSRLWIAPGNPGTAQHGENIPLSAEQVPGLVEFACQNAVDLAVVGPEGALAAGLSDALVEAGIPAFGPTRAAAEIETSKVFSKQFMQRHNIPTARFAAFTDLDAALQHLASVDYPVVIKASGLAAGKGVLLPESQAEARAALEEILVARRFGSAGDAVVIEERLVGEEVSLLAFSDGLTVAAMPPAQDHKRLKDGDLGPNTGGMGAYAPAPACPPELVDAVVRTVLQPAIDGLRAEGRPFVGVLYAGLMLTQHGIKVLEFNARFGDPETQVILPLLESDLLEILAACTRQGLASVPLRWSGGAAACVVMASAGYPDRASARAEIRGLEGIVPPAVVFYAGTAFGALGGKGGAICAVGGRVLGVTATGASLAHAVDTAYAAVRQIRFEGAQFRSDIARKGLLPHPGLTGAEPAESHKSASAYAQAGVNIDAGNRAVDLMKDAVRSTYTPRVLAGIGAFGGLFDAADVQAMRRPVLVASTDGVGTKVKLAARLGRYRGIGMDIVNHCINDILVQGARPLFFLDYFAAGRLAPEVVAEIVAGIAAACLEAGSVLIGGETAEMPGVYAEGEFDLAGTVVGCVEYEQVLRSAGLQAGDVLVGLRSSGPHTNGYSLLRQVFEHDNLEAFVPELGGTLADALLAPHRSYLNLLLPLIQSGPPSGLSQEGTRPIKALAHLTGGGFLENIPRILPQALGAQIRRGSWPMPPLFQLVQRRSAIPDEELYRVFNLGIGMVIVASPDQAAVLQAAIPEETWVIGEVVPDPKHRVRLT